MPHWVWVTLGLRGWQHIQVGMTYPEVEIYIRQEPKASEDKSVDVTRVREVDLYGEKGTKARMNANTITK